jgi:hypothetical protein
MFLEIVGGLLVFALGSTSISLWFALQKLNARYDDLLDAVESVQIWPED